jgi:hypothetical protein
MRVVATSTLIVITVCALGCGASVDSEPAGDASVDTSASEVAAEVGPSEGGSCAPESCCCAGDVVDFPVCSGDTISCRSGYALHSGDDCRCLPDRDTPCCYPHVFDSGVPSKPDADASDGDGDTAPEASAETGATDAACAVDLCCCAGDVVWFPTCSDGAASCSMGALHSGDDCRCLPDRDTPCCLPHVFDAGH